MKTLFNCTISQQKLNKTSFKSKVHIIDGGSHANQMEHFAKSVLKNINKVDDLQMHHVECCKKAEALKRMDSVEEKLKELLFGNQLKKGDYVSILGLVSVPVLNLADRLKVYTGNKTTVNFRNVKAQKALLMRYLAAIYNNPDKYKKEVGYMDRVDQHMENAYGVINLINQMKKNGIKVFLPAGNGADNTIKWFAKKYGINQELYKYISTGSDTNGVVAKLLREMDNKNYYDFNLLSMSDANIVNVNGANNKNYIFSAKDGFVNAEARGVYNFTPIRDFNGNIKGYGFHDGKTVDFPHEKFDNKTRVENLNKFVGLDYHDVNAGAKETSIYRNLVRRNASTSDIPDKLYKISDVFDENVIEHKKLNILGQFIDRDQKLIYDINPQGQVIFHKTNCEGSDRPSVYSMWGSCFSTVNAIKDDLLKPPLETPSMFMQLLVSTAMFIGAALYLRSSQKNK